MAVVLAFVLSGQTEKPGSSCFWEDVLVEIVT